MKRTGGLAAVAVALLLAAGCTGVPSSSQPQTVESVPLGQQAPAQSISPAPNASPRELVSQFLQAGAVGSGAAARLFLTKQASSGWRTDSATIISGEVVGTYNPKNETVTVVGRSFGALNAAGIYKPTLDGDGTGGARQTFQFKLAQVDGQFRIDQLQPGLLLTNQQFQNNYIRHSLYFFDNAHQYLVQDPRYSAIDDPKQLAAWLLQQLAAGPRPELSSAVTPSLPAQGPTTKNTVTVGATTDVDIPGAGQLDAVGRKQLAASLSQTLSDPLSDGTMSITDDGAPVSIEGLGNTFHPSDFAGYAERLAPPQAVYYLSNGRVFDERGHRLPGPLGNGSNYLRSIAMGQPTPSGPMLVAGVEGTGTQQRLLVGTEKLGLRPTSVHGALTRPASAPGLPEVWIGVGNQVERVTVSGTTSQVSTVPIQQATSPAPRILALRLSPDGERIALVLDRGPGQGGQLFVASIERNTGTVKIDQLTPISPQLASITDVAWLSPVKLYAVGRMTTSEDPQVFDTDVDGSDWTAHGLGLSNVADSVTVAAGAAAWVSAGGFVWEQGVSGWGPPTGGGQTAGTNPVYVE